MVQIHSVELPLFIYFYFFACSAFKTGSKKEKFEMILDDVYSCPEAHPPYTKNPRILSNFTVNVLKGKRYLIGNTTVTKPTPCRNFNVRTFSVNNTNREIKMQIAGVSCKNLFARAIIAFTNMSMTQKNCVLNQGRYQYDNMDINKISHALPNWHGPGHLIHQLQIVSDGATEFCVEVSVTIT